MIVLELVGAAGAGAGVFWWVRGLVLSRAARKVPPVAFIDSRRSRAE